MAALEGGTAAVAVSSGMAAQFLAISALCKAGDNIVSQYASFIPFVGERILPMEQLAPLWRHIQSVQGHFQELWHLCQIRT